MSKDRPTIQPYRDHREITPGDKHYYKRILTKEPLTSAQEIREDLGRQSIRVNVHPRDNRVGKFKS